MRHSDAVEDRTAAEPAGGAFPAELSASSWVVLFNEAGYRVDEASIVAARNALLDNLALLRGAFWLPKNLLLLQPRASAGSPQAAKWEARARKALANRAAVQWFNMAPSLPQELLDLLVQDALDYQVVLLREVQAIDGVDGRASGAQSTVSSPPNNNNNNSSSSSSSSSSSNHSNHSSSNNNSNNSSSSQRRRTLRNCCPAANH